MRAKPESATSSQKLSASNLIVLVESVIKYCTKTLKNSSCNPFKKKCASKMIVLLLLAIYRGIDSE